MDEGGAVSADVVADCRAEIANRPTATIPSLRPFLTAFSALLDLHEPYEAHGWDDDGPQGVFCVACEGPWPCRTVAVVAAGLGVNMEPGPAGDADRGKATT